MKHLIPVSMLLVACLLGCQPETDSSTRPEAASSQSQGDQLLTVADPISHENLTIFPVLSKTPQTADQFITLDEGLQAGSIEIREGSSSGFGNNPPEDSDAFDSPVTSEFTDPNEQAPVAPANQPTDDDVQGTVDLEDLFDGGSDQPSGDGLEDPFGDGAGDPFGDGAGDPFGDDTELQSVNRLWLTNRSDKPLYLMPGELILGGDQDRMIAQETIIPPNVEGAPIEVYCVEQGRWGGRDPSRTREELQTFAMSMEMDDLSLDAESQRSSLVVSASKRIAEGKFATSVGAVTNPVRKAAQIDRMQEQVWSKVELENSMGTVMAPTGSFTANYVQSDNLERLEPYMSALSNQVAERENVVGVIVAVNGELVSMDVFNSTPLFRKLWPKMLKGFALQAANDPAFGEVEACDVEDAREFLAESIGASVTTTLQSGQVAVERRESDDVICLTGRPSDDYAESYGGAMGGGGFGAVHSAVFPKSGGE